MNIEAAAAAARGRVEKEWSMKGKAVEHMGKGWKSGK